jgi:hypothetical protein
MVNTDKLRDISAQDLAMLGADDLAYVRPILLENETMFAVNTADGRQIAVADDWETAVMAAHEHRYHTVSVH